MGWEWRREEDRRKHQKVGKEKNDERKDRRDERRGEP